jgi:hypothetical protein
MTKPQTPVQKFQSGDEVVWADLFQAATGHTNYVELFGRGPFQVTEVFPNPNPANTRYTPFQCHIARSDDGTEIPGDWAEYWFAPMPVPVFKVEDWVIWGEVRPVHGESYGWGPFRVAEVNPSSRGNSASAPFLLRLVRTDGSAVDEEWAEDWFVSAQAPSTPSPAG